MKLHKWRIFYGKIINYENLRSLTYSNDKLIKGTVKGIVLHFFGLGNMTIHNTDPDEAFEYAKRGIIYLTPYYNPWCWMNKQAVHFVDEIIEVISEKYNLDKSVRIVSTGASMGGLCSLVYCAYAKITPCACVANSPVCDLNYHYSERPDLPRTLYAAFREYEGSFEDALKSSSPIHIIEKLPDIPYKIFHCEEDKLVSLEIHSAKFVSVMKLTHNIELKRVPLPGHCAFTDEARTEYMNTIINNILING